MWLDGMIISSARLTDLVRVCHPQKGDPEGKRGYMGEVSPRRGPRTVGTFVGTLEKSEYRSVASGGTGQIALKLNGQVLTHTKSYRAIP